MEFPHFYDVKLRSSSGDDSDHVREGRGYVSTGIPNMVGLSRSFTDHTGRCRSSSLTLRRLMSYIYGAPILDVSRSHTTTQHSR